MANQCEIKIVRCWKETSHTEKEPTVVKTAEVLPVQKEEKPTVQEQIPQKIVETPVKEAKIDNVSQDVAIEENSICRVLAISNYKIAYESFFTKQKESNMRHFSLRKLRNYMRRHPTPFSRRKK